MRNLTFGDLQILLVVIWLVLTREIAYTFSGIIVGGYKYGKMR